MLQVFSTNLIYHILHSYYAQPIRGVLYFVQSMNLVQWSERNFRQINLVMTKGGFVYSVISRVGNELHGHKYSHEGLNHQPR